MTRYTLLLVLPLACSAVALRAAEVSRAATYAERIRADHPVAYWTFAETDGEVTRNVSDLDGGGDADHLAGHLKGARLGLDGPRANHYPGFDARNLALGTGGAGVYVQVRDPGAASPLDFTNGDSLTMEAWVRPTSLAENRQVYIVGKGRTHNEGQSRDNQNYALRLRGIGGRAHVSFLFRASATEESPQAYHRWNSELGFTVDDAWHHVAIVYTFGEPDSVRAYVDGRECGGSWDMGGPTNAPPVVDNDDLWIGAAMGGATGGAFQGLIDEVAIYRRELDGETLIARYEADAPDLREAEFAAATEVGSDAVRVELHEGLSPEALWPLTTNQPVLAYHQERFAFIGHPRAYTATGVIQDRPNPFLIRARTRRRVTADEAGAWELLLRCKSAARLYVDGQLVLQTPFLAGNGSGHEDVPELAEGTRGDLRPLPPGCQERLAEVMLEAGEHVFRLDAIVGGKGLRLEMDELCAAIARPDSSFLLLGPSDLEPRVLTEEAWDQEKVDQHQLLTRLNQETRRRASTEWTEYWENRHALARRHIESKPPLAIPTSPAELPIHDAPRGNAIDRFIGAKLADRGVKPSALTDDYAFLRRVTLDTAGVSPSREEISVFLRDPSPARRANVIERLLTDPRWADHWVGYWQDVLAENPGILKPQLNNTGPFRWWIHESFLDNKPLDQFATELIMMEGSAYGGGPAGFAMATQNDAPHAAKAHVLAKAFLAMDMTCARCHDAPYHPFKQRQLFSLAAMLDRRPITLPATSSVPQSAGARQPLVEISIRPGDQITPDWPLAEIDPPTDIDALTRDGADTRQQFAAVMTSATNDRFAKVAVNRLWSRYLGRGLIEPVDDWESVEGRASHPELLEYLARELVVSGYDLRYVARLILNSHAYQRVVDPRTDEYSELFAAPRRRRMTAEQVVDSLFAAAGKPFRAEALTLDPEGRRAAETFLNLGEPRRAWQLTSLSNERDRPALALPMAQGLVDLLQAYGWRDSRPNPLTVRDNTPTVLQPLTLANGVIGNRGVRLSDDNALTELCLRASPSELIDQACLQILSRPATDSERTLLASVIEDGFARRVRDAASTHKPRRARRNAVSWSNHLSAEATRIKRELEREVLAGDPPTDRLDTDWRHRMEDVVWALFNSPEFVFVP